VETSPDQLKASAPAEIVVEEPTRPRRTRAAPVVIPDEPLQQVETRRDA
jgi:hypothetical protein